MKINSDINVLGSIADYNLIIDYIKATQDPKQGSSDFQAYSNIKTTQSFKRYERAIKSTLLKFTHVNLEHLVIDDLLNQGITSKSLLLLFWNSSINNEFLHYLNTKVFFPAYYSGRISIKKEEVIACIRELRQKETAIQEWTDSTIDVTARKYIALLVKFTLMSGGHVKAINHPFIDDRLLILFVYWLLAIEPKPNILKSQWLIYSLMEKEVFIERITHKSFRKYISFQYSGDNLKIEPVIKYEELHDKLA